MEIWDIYDKNRVKTDRTMVRGTPIASGDYHLVVHICIFNSRDEMLIQQRQSFKDSWSNQWDITVGGSAVSGDSSGTAATRELFEELGYRYDFTDIRPHFSINFERGFDDYYLLNADIALASLRLQPEEVQAVKWATRGEIHAMLEHGKFVPFLGSLIDLTFEMRSRYSCHTD